MTLIKVVLALAAYAVAGGLTFALCKYLGVGVDRGFFYRESWFMAGLLSMIWPVGLFVIVGIAVATKLGDLAEAASDATRRRAAFREAEEQARLQELNEIARQLDEEFKGAESDN
jgi:hypothetical protein